MEIQTPFREDLVLRAANTARESKRNLAASTGTIRGVTSKSVVAHVIPGLHAKVPENALYNVGVPLERIPFDILGPLPRSSDGNNNILVVMDYFTKWPEAYSIPDQEASTVAEVLVEH
ncbi:retrovirus-related Pol polyprotein from transposon 412 [Trichonephila clavipes]|nr:retrovirus-related Pol polyprotein from transposon 412 [Trichonephila clavipes]GFT65335.1 retrovirus-related Pol polyprotein from transposon 412 [Trichonephila clavipes]